MRESGFNSLASTATLAECQVKYPLRKGCFGLNQSDFHDCLGAMDDIIRKYESRKRDTGGYLAILGAGYVVL